MAAYHVLVSCPLIRDSISQYDHRFEQHEITYDVPDVEQQLDEDELLKIIDRYDGVIAGDDEFTRTVFERAERLQIVSKWGIGTDNIDQRAADTHGVEVTNTPGVFDDEVSDVVFGYAIMLTRQLHRIDRAVRDGEWACPRGTSLSGKTLGVVGVGDIGSAVARRGAAHGMSVIGNDIEPLPADLRDEIPIEAVGKDELFDRAHVVSLNCALTPGTRGLVDREALERLGPDGYLINTARGKLVDQDALVEALETKTIAGAALDVFEEEPLPPSSPLVEFDNVIFGSHNAQNTSEAVSRTNDRAVQNLIEGLVH